MLFHVLSSLPRRLVFSSPLSWTATVVMEIAGSSYSCSGVGHAGQRQQHSKARKEEEGRVECFSVYWRLNLKSRRSTSDPPRSLLCCCSPLLACVASLSALPVLQRVAWAAAMPRSVPSPMPTGSSFSHWHSSFCTMGRSQCTFCLTSGGEPEPHL
jgi:hypothetical protein